jgi:hypothetical protein
MPHRKPRQSPEGRHVRQTPARLLGQLNAALGKYDVLAFKGPRFTVRVGQGSKKFHPRAGKLPCPGRGIGAMARRIPDVVINGAVMTITEYLAATILVALVLWAVLGLLMQES